MGKMTKKEKMVSALQNELREAKDMISRLEHQKVEWEREFCSWLEGNVSTVSFYTTDV